jgi:hypothetical protein
LDEKFVGRAWVSNYRVNHHWRSRLATLIYIGFAIHSLVAFSIPSMISGVDPLLPRILEVIATFLVSFFSLGTEGKWKIESGNMGMTIHKSSRYNEIARHDYEHTCRSRNKN